MNGDPVGPDYASPAETRLGEHLTVLRTDPPRSGPELLASVLRAVRWQRTARESLLAIGRLAGALANGIHVLLKPEASRRP